MKSKNKKGGGTFTKLKNGTIEFTVSIGYDECGKRQRKKFYGKTETECRGKYREFIKEGEKPKKVQIEHTLSTWLDEWLVTYKSQKVQSSTYEEYVKLAARIKNHKIGNMKLTQIKPIHVTEFFTAIIDYSQSVRKKTRFLITAAFESAVDNDYCSKNPVKRAEIAKKQQIKMEVFTEDEAKTIIEFAKTDKKFGLAMYILLTTGIRSGELRALTVSKIDFERGVIRIDTAVKANYELGLPKNNEPRDVPLEPKVLAFL